MSKKNKKKIKETTIEDYYDLKVDKVDELVAALKGEDVPEDEEVNYSMNYNMGVDDPKNYTRSGKEKKFDPYRTDFLSKVPVWVRALFVKFWFAGMVCWFFMFGIGQSGMDAVFILGLALGVVVDVLVNPLLFFMETEKREFHAYMMFPFPFKAIWTFFANIFYYLIVVYGVSLFYNIVNQLFFVAVEPMIFGVFAFIVDMIFIGIKDGIVAIVRHVRNRNKEKALNV